MGKLIFSVALCSSLLMAAPVVAKNKAASADAVVDAATYKPKTKHDNTPYRFDMEQNGKRMSAEEFDAWMKARGVRVATGKPAPVAEASLATAGK